MFRGWRGCGVLWDEVRIDGFVAVLDSCGFADSSAGQGGVGCRDGKIADKDHRGRIHDFLP